jgi:Spy/CpxP family protein refolding chaperone
MAKLIVILGFILSLAAGVVIGSKAIAPASSDPPQPPTTAPTNRPSRGGWLSQELGLSPDQREKLDAIWSATANRGRDDHNDRRRDFRRERDAAIADLVPAARLGEYDQIINTYNDRVAALEQESREAYEAAVEKTKEILTPEQRVRYEELLKRHKWGPGAARDRHGGRRSETRASTPATASSLPDTTKGQDR